MMGPLLANNCQDLCRPARRVRYAKKLKENEEKLWEEVHKLEARSMEIERSSDKSSIYELKNWIDRAKKVEADARGLKHEYDKIANQSCRCIHFISRSRLRKAMEKKTKAVVDVWSEGEFWTRENLDRRGPPNLQGKPFFHEHRVRTLISILREERIRIIGIWGMVGTGKTTILDSLQHTILDRLKHKKEAEVMYDTVVSITISENWGVKELQHEIMTHLNLNFQSCAEADENAGRISEVLQTKKCLILLDNFEKKIDLDQTIGIRDNLTDSKVVLASRSRKIFSVMKVDYLINVEPLSNDDAWFKFKETVGEVIDNFPRVEQIAQLVARECNGLPLLIDTLGSNFRKKGDNFHSWVDGLKDLQTWQNLEGISDVFKYLESCYHDLNDTQKNCFLYCALYPEECKICVDNLTECWIAEDFFPNARNFRDGRNLGHSALHDLIDVSFLVRIDGRKFVKMPRLLRNMAIKISSQKQGSKLLVNPSKDEWDQASHISLMDSELKTLPETPNCTNLLTLLLQVNKDFLAIPTEFFQSMRSLQVLDLHGTGVKSLPPSLSKLVSLKALYLNFCSRLEKLPSTIKSLKRLEVLDIRKTKVDLRQIRRLTWLKCLRMSSSNLFQRKYTKGKISGFISLEEFSVDGDSWHIDGIAKAVAEEVATLEHLTFLQFSFHNVECLQSFVEKSPRWQHHSFTFQFCVGSQNSAHSQILDSVDYPFRNSLKLVNTRGNNDAISPVLKETDIFELIKHERVSRLSDFNINNMEKMLVCWIEECDSIAVIIDGDGIEKKAVLTHLKELHLKRVNQLERIWQGRVHPGCLAQLTTLTLSNCPNLKTIFSRGLIQELQDLQCLKVEECDQIEEIIMTSEAQGLEVGLPKLKILELTSLPALRSILDDSFNWQWPSLEKVKVSLCRNLTRLPFNNVNVPKLMLIEGEERWWKALQWRDPAHKQNSQSLFTPSVQKPLLTEDVED